MTLTRRRFLKISLITALGTATASVAGFSYAHDIEPDWPEIVQREFTLSRLDSAFDGFRIAHISDIHMGTGMSGNRLARIAALINAQQPDAIVITGDFITSGKINSLAESLTRGLSALQAPDRVAVLGNHDHWADPEGVRGILRDTGIIDLSNRVHTLKRGSAALHLCGVDDYWERLDRLDQVLDELPSEGAAVLLAHEPDFADVAAAAGRFDLQLSGHTHGGQVILPVLNRPLVLPRLGRKYPLGTYRVGTMFQYTNRGLGTIRPAVRFNCRPEITLITLRAETTVTAAPTGV